MDVRLLIYCISLAGQKIEDRNQGDDAREFLMPKLGQYSVKINSQWTKEAAATRQGELGGTNDLGRVHP